MTTPSVLEFEARSYELDPYGHLNNAVYVNWLEHGRLGFLRDRGHDYMSVPDAFGVHIVVVHQELAYKIQVRLGDVLAVSSRIARFGNTSFTFEQTVAFADSRIAAAGTVTMVCVRDGKPAPMPPGLRAILDS